MTNEDILEFMPHAEFEVLNSEDEFKFNCAGCGDCCRNLKNVALVEPLDLYRIAKNLGIHIEDAAAQYTKPLILSWGYPVLTLRTKQHLDACVFLKNSKCSLYELRPRACRLYPLNAGPDDKNPGKFINLIDVKRKHHYTGVTYRAGEWMDEYFSLEEREAMQLDFKFAAEFARLRENIDSSEAEWLERIMLLYRYRMYVTAEDFLPQFIRNLAIIKNHMKMICKGSQ